MPIKGLSDARRIPRLGKIHLGLRNEKGYPMKVDYFICPPEVQAIFGEKPKELRILIPVEDEERWASQYYRCYSQTRGLICKGDGILAVRMVDIKTGDLAGKDTKETKMQEITCEGRDCPDYKVRCKEVMNLQFLLPEVAGLGIWQIDTSSVNSIRNINAMADLVKRIYGRIAMIPLLLTVEPLQVTTPEGKKNTVYVMNMHTRETLVDMMRSVERPVAEMLSEMTGEEFTAEEILELPTPDDEVPELIIPANQEQPKVDPTFERRQRMEQAGLRRWPNVSGDTVRRNIGQWIKDKKYGIWADMTPEKQEEAITKMLEEAELQG